MRSLVHSCADSQGRIRRPAPQNDAKLSLLIAFIWRTLPANNINEIPDSLDLQQPQGKWSDPATLGYTLGLYYFACGWMGHTTLEKLATSRAQNAKRETTATTAPAVSEMMLCGEVS